jgi:CPA2 family monovalent cation:H+ antiporter-2
VLAVVAIIMLGKTVAAIALVLLFRYPLNTALTVGTGLAQIGEFSFILAGLGMALGLLSIEANSLILAGALISIALNSLMFTAIKPGLAWIRQHSELARRLERSEDPLAQLPVTVDEKQLTGQVVLVGYGRVGRRIATQLEAAGIPYVAAEQNRELVEALRARNIPAVSGDASTPEVLIQAHIHRAGLLVITSPDSLQARRMVEIARELNPGVEILLRTHSDEESGMLTRDKIGTVFFSEDVLAQSMSRHILERMKAGAHPCPDPRVTD